MKITEFVLAFLIVASTIFFSIEIKSEKTNDFTKLNNHNEWAMTTAGQDAVKVLSTNVVPRLESGYNSYKITATDPQLAFETFIDTLALNYRTEDENTKDVLQRYIPVFAVMDYDGLYLNVYKEHIDAEGNTITSRKWLPKIPFSYTDEEGNIINFSIDETIEIYDIDLDEWYDGKRTELLSYDDITIPLLEDPETFDKVRRNIIVNTLQEHFAYYINEHNAYTKKLDITYTFTLPLIEKEEWYNTVDNIGVFAFFQGYQYNALGEAYNEYAFVGTRIDKKERILAGLVDGVPKFWNETCNLPHTANEVYSSKKDAAARGYSELACVN